LRAACRQLGATGAEGFLAASGKDKFEGEKKGKVETSSGGRKERVFGGGTRLFHAWVHQNGLGISRKEGKVYTLVQTANSFAAEVGGNSVRARAGRKVRPGKSNLLDSRRLGG